jgi:flagellar hook-length control protein FliK
VAAGDATAPAATAQAPSQAAPPKITGETPAAAPAKEAGTAGAEGGKAPPAAPATDAADAAKSPPADKPPATDPQRAGAQADAADPPPPADTARSDAARTDLPTPAAAAADTSRLAGPSLAAAAQQSQSPAVTVPQLAATIIAHAKQGESRFQIRLDPPDLGRIDVSLSIDQSGSAATVLTVEKMDTLDLLQRDSRALERALNTAGFRTEQGSLQFNLRDPGTGSHGSSQHNAQGDPNGQWRRVVVSDAEAAAPLLPLQHGLASYDPAHRRLGGLDIKV